MQLLGLKLLEAIPIIKKNLILNYLYKFVSFNENDIDFNDKSKLLFSLQKYEKPIPITISCIIGKNGSGKSTLLEIIYRIINNLSFDIFGSEVTLSYSKGFHAQLFVEIDKKIAIIEINNRNDFLTIYETNSDSKELSRKIYNLCSDTLPKTFFSDLSYTIVNNYSYYSFNQDDFYYDETINGDWLEHLFNKNDGYKTPLVINPKRDYWGSIDNENESELCISRVNTMFIYFFKEKHIKLLENYTIEGLSINYRPFKLTESHYDNINEYVHIIYGRKQYGVNQNGSDSLFNHLVEYLKTHIISSLFLDDLINERNYCISIWNNHEDIFTSTYTYLAYKILKISATYNRWSEYFKYNTSEIYLEEELLLKHILLKEQENRDHVTLKLFQCIEFIKNPSLYFNDFVPLDKISPDKKNLDDYFCFLPPVFMSPQIILKNGNNTIALNNISSGERQKIYSLSYIIYHIKNILSKKQNSIYNNFCIIFDEAELYMHPEFQRTFIYDLVTLLNNCSFETLASVNILIATHSPYIISEVPKSNILCIDNGSEHIFPPDNNTYCANYYDLMKNSFLLNFSISELARTNIQELLDDCNIGVIEDASKIQKYEQIKKDIADPYLRNIIDKMLEKSSKKS